MICSTTKRIRQVHTTAEGRAIREGGGFGSIIGRNSFQRDKAAASRLLDAMVRIYRK
jgi:DhnA family fructose-bisphosphate aldolase class Ia